MGQLVLCQKKTLIIDRLTAERRETALRAERPAQSA